MPGVFLYNLLNGLRDHARFIVLAPHDAGLKDKDEVGGIEVRRFRYGPDYKEILAYRGEMQSHVRSAPLSVLRFFLSFKSEAIRLAESGEFDLIWAHWWIPGGWVGAKAVAKSGCPMVITCHGTDIHMLNAYPLLRRAGSRVFAAAERITVVSSFLKDSLVAAIGGKVSNLSDRISVAPMPIDTELFSFDEIVIPEGGSIITASRLTKQKNLDVLIHAAKRLMSDDVSFTLDIYGDGPERENLEALIDSLELGSLVRIHSPIPQRDLADRYRKSEIAALVSEREGLGLMLPEAMLCGCAAVGSRSGGITDIITDDGTDGQLVEPGDVESLYRVLKSLLTDRERLSNLRRSCLSTAQQRYSTDSTVEAFRQILRLG